MGMTQSYIEHIEYIVFKYDTSKYKTNKCKTSKTNFV